MIRRRLLEGRGDAKRPRRGRHFATFCMGALAVVGCAGKVCPSSAGAARGSSQTSRPKPEYREIAEAPFPAPPQHASASLLDAWRLADTLVVTPRDPASSPEAEADLRRWAIDGFMASESAKKDLFLRATLALRAGAATASAEEQTIAAALTGRMEESLASDWSGVHVIECVADPTVCGWASVVIANAKRAWLDRALERYAACADLARDEPLAVWARFCGDRIAMIRGLSVMRERGAIAPERR